MVWSPFSWVLFAAFVMMLLFSVGHLPIYDPPNYNRAEKSSFWSLAMGLLVAIVSFTLWEPQQHVFLDRTCINSEDADTKTEAIFSLAGMLKESKGFPYFRKPPLICFVCRYFAFFLTEQFLRSSTLGGKAEVRQLGGMRSAFCDAQHVDEQGNQLLCDREAGAGCGSVAILHDRCFCVSIFLCVQIYQRCLVAHTLRYWSSAWLFGSVASAPLKSSCVRRCRRLSSEICEKMFSQQPGPCKSHRPEACKCYSQL